MAEATKQCLRCEQDLPLATFSRHRGRPDGLQAYCKTCTSKITRASLARTAARATRVTLPEKCCGGCEQVLPIDEFYVDLRRPDGRYANCKACHRRITDEWKAANKTAVRESQRANYWRDPTKRRASSMAYRLRNLDAARARGQAYKRANRARATAVEAIRRARLAGAPGEVTPEQIAARVAYFGGRCWMCGDQWEAIDHVKPLSKGGSNWAANLRPACRSCNSRKNGRWYGVRRLADLAA